jgi:hypothetical protein
MRTSGASCQPCTPYFSVALTPSIFCPAFTLPCNLEHVINPAANVFAPKIDLPAEAGNVEFCAPVSSNGILSPYGILDISRPKGDIACKCVFKSLGWARQPPTPVELLRAFNLPCDDK